MGSERRAGFCFNLVIERLLISGTPSDMHLQPLFQVSISLSSGFSFQVFDAALVSADNYEGFNLVIERLLISGSHTTI